VTSVNGRARSKKTTGGKRRRQKHRRNTLYPATYVRVRMSVCMCMLASGVRHTPNDHAAPSAVRGVASVHQQVAPGPFPVPSTDSEGATSLATGECRACTHTQTHTRIHIHIHHGTGEGKQQLGGRRASILLIPEETPSSTSTQPHNPPPHIASRAF
jgi:hypothetical protein